MVGIANIELYFISISQILLLTKKSYNCDMTILKIIHWVLFFPLIFYMISMIKEYIMNDGYLNPSILHPFLTLIFFYALVIIIRYIKFKEKIFVPWQKSTK